MANQKRSKSEAVVNLTVGTQTQRVSTPPPPPGEMGVGKGSRGVGHDPRSGYGGVTCVSTQEFQMLDDVLVH